MKELFRLIKYPEARTNFFREKTIRKEQGRNIARYDKTADSLIIFFVPGADRSTLKETISGGVISLVSLCEETAKLYDVHRAQTVMCTFPREFLLLKHVNFANDTELYSFEQVVGYFKSVKHIIIHLPDDLAKPFLDRLFTNEKEWLSEMESVHINIVNANILLMPTLEVLSQIKGIATKMTMTAAHVKYCNLFYRKHFGMPLHLFSTWVSPEQYIYKDYSEKKEIIVVSPDGNSDKERVLTTLRQNTNLEVITLQGLTHDVFKQTIANAKWALTFGEGLDGYLVEPVFSGSFGFAVYNEDFFTEDFKNLNGIFSSYDDLNARIVEVIKGLDNSVAYTSAHKNQFDMCAKYYSFSAYRDNIRKFYLNQYTYQ
ncbi:MAG: hypothetical protein HOP08_17015 [Cyclobacteriaceae bacterium]|nr:hypothetical protein [Cyclobacteriaceae bacterium]